MPGEEEGKVGGKPPREKGIEQIKAEARVFALTGNSSSWNVPTSALESHQNYQPLPLHRNSLDEDEDYLKMIQSLGSGNNTLMDLDLPLDMFEDDDDMEFQLEDEDEAGDESSSSCEEEEEILEDSSYKKQVDSSETTPTIQNTNTAPSFSSPDAMQLLEYDVDDVEEQWMKDLQANPDYFKDLEEELGSLLEEDTYAAERALLLDRNANNSNSSNESQATANQNSTLPPATAKVDLKKSDASTRIEENTAKRAKAIENEDEDKFKISITENTDLFSSPSRDKKSHHHPSAPQATPAQMNKLQELLQKHYQGLIQQSILAIRAAQEIKNPVAVGNSWGYGHSIGLPTTNGADNNKICTAEEASGKSTNAAKPTANVTPSPKPSPINQSFFLSGETDMDLAEVLDLAVKMLQDLDQHRKDAIRTAIQLEALRNRSEEGKDGNDGMEVTSPLPGRRSLLSDFEESTSRSSAKSEPHSQSQPESRRLTRAAFQRLQEQPTSSRTRRTAFDIPGLARLKQTFASMDKSVATVVKDNLGKNKDGTSNDDAQWSNDIEPSAGCNILKAPTHAQACRNVLKEAGACINETQLPGTSDVAENFSSMEDCLSIKHFTPPCTEQQELFLRKNRNLFTSAEDNLVLRGVNLYGEKQWLLISDRYLPDRSVNIISQRYSKLCVMLYKARGVQIDDQGNLAEPPKLESVDDIDEEMVKAAGLVKVEPPAILNVHRWSLEEDVALLKAVPIMGHMWAELGARLIPHRDRGHLRKRYQVLERRVKATIGREKKTVTKKRGPDKTKRVTTSVRKATTPTTKAASKTGGATKMIGRTGNAKKSVGNTRAVETKEKATKVTATKQSNSSDSAKNAAPAAVKPQSTETNPAMSLEWAAATLAQFQAAASNNRGIATQPTSGAANPYQHHPYYSTYPLPAGTAWPYSHPHYQQGAYPYHYPPGAFSYQHFPPATGATQPRCAPPAVGALPPYTLPPSSAMAPPPTPASLEKAAPQKANLKATRKSPSPTPASLEKAASKEKASEKVTAVMEKAAAKITASNAKASATAAASRMATHNDEVKKAPSAPAPPKSKISAPGAASKPPTKSPQIKALSGALKQKARPRTVSLKIKLREQDDNSRLACEKLVDGHGEEEWSQMAGVKELMAKEEGKEASNVIVSHLARSPGRDANTLSQFPGGLEAMSNISGLSVLNEGTRQAPEKSTEDKKDSDSGMGLMARVLANSTSQSSNALLPGVAKPAKANASDKAEIRPSTSSIHVSTPGRKPSGGGLFSPGFQSPTALLRAGAGLNTNMSIPYSPTNSTVMGIFDEDKSNPASGDSLLRILPTDSQLQRDMVGSTEVADNTSMRRQYSDISAVVGAAGNNNSLLIGTDDYEAVSALEALSNSPFQHASQQSAKDESPEDDKKPTAAGGGSARQSLFSKVIGGSKKNKKWQEKDKTEAPPKKKLKF